MFYNYKHQVLHSSLNSLNLSLVMTTVYSVWAPTTHTHWAIFITAATDVWDRFKQERRAFPQESVGGWR